MTSAAFVRHKTHCNKQPEAIWYFSKLNSECINCYFREVSLHFLYHLISIKKRVLVKTSRLILVIFLQLGTPCNITERRVCENEIGSYSCVCMVGYKVGDGNTCVEGSFTICFQGFSVFSVPFTLDTVKSLYSWVLYFTIFPSFSLICHFINRRKCSTKRLYISGNICFHFMCFREVC